MIDRSELLAAIAAAAAVFMVVAAPAAILALSLGALAFGSLARLTGNPHRRTAGAYDRR